MAAHMAAGSRSKTRRDPGSNPADPPRDHAPDRPRRTGPQSANDDLEPLTPRQQTLVRDHVGLVGLHLRTRVPTPEEPRREREYEDLFQEGCVGLLRAAVGYDPERDGPFARFALPRIRRDVHLALRERFSLIRVPVRAADERRRDPDRVLDPALEPTASLTAEPLVDNPPDARPPAEAETLRLALRRRFERAVAAALAELRARTWQYRNPCQIMARIATERLLIDDPQARTPLRRIAHEVSVCVSRVIAYERQLTTVVGQHFATDPHPPLLLAFVHEDPAGFGGVLDPVRRRRLARAELETFETRFGALERGDQGALLIDMLQRFTVVSEIARNLYQLTLRDEPEPLDVPREC